jgi:hypothetical protein
MNFDLNIDNYTISELIEMFDLPSNYDNNILEINEAKLRENIINNKEISKETQTRTLQFLIKAKNIILNKNNRQKLDPKLKRDFENIYHTNYELQPIEITEKNEHMLQVREESNYVNSYPSEFFSGKINPLAKRTIQKILNIDSRFRDNYYSSPSTNYNVTLPIFLDNIIRIQLSAIELPTTYYVISKQYGNNFFNITINKADNTTISSVVNIPDGNYTQTSIVDAINNQLALLGTDFAHVVFAINLTNNSGSAQMMVGLNDLTFATSIELNFQADRFGVEDRGTPLPLKFGWIIGFRNGIYVNNQNYVSEGCVDTTGPRYFFLVIDDYNNNVNNNFYSAFNSSMLNKNILARISLQANTFNVLEQNNLNIVSTPRDYFGPVTISNLNIQLLDEYGRIVDLNNMDYSFCLLLTTTYDL